MHEYFRMNNAHIRYSFVLFATPLTVAMAVHTAFHRKANVIATYNSAFSMTLRTSLPGLLLYPQCLGFASDHRLDLKLMLHSSLVLFLVLVLSI